MTRESNPFCSYDLLSEAGYVPSEAEMTKMAIDVGLTVSSFVALLTTGCRETGVSGEAKYTSTPESTRTPEIVPMIVTPTMIPPTETTWPTGTFAPTETQKPTKSAEEVAVVNQFGKWGIGQGTYTLSKIDGVVVAIDNETHKEIYDGGYNLRFFLGRIPDTVSTQYGPDLSKRVFVNLPSTECRINYVLPIYKQWMSDYIIKHGVGPFDGYEDFGFLPVMLSLEIKSYGFVGMVSAQDEKGETVGLGKYLVYEDTNGEVQTIPLMPILGTEIITIYNQ